VRRANFLMKTTHTITSLAAACLAASFAHLIDFTTIDVLTLSRIAGAALAISLLALAWFDYRRKPTFRVRRSAGRAESRFPELPAEVPPPDWTYTSRAR